MVIFFHSMDSTNLEQMIRRIILDNQNRIDEGSYVERELSVERIKGKATIITGMRRTGKSVYQHLYCQKLKESGVPKENFCILDFSDDRLFGLRSHDPAIIADAYYALFAEKTQETVYFFFDEIQYLHHWELFVNRLMNTLPCQVNITGSSAKLLVKEIATEFGGRSLAWELYPFSFSEYVASKKKVRTIPPLPYMSSEDIQYVRQWCDEYLSIGGIPESLLMNSETTRVKFLQDLAHTVVFRDVIERFNLTNVTELRRLMQMVLNQMGGLTSFSKLKSRMAGEGYRISAAMVRDAIEYYEDAYLIHTVEIFSMNRAVRSTNLKKFYASDHALAMAVSQTITANLGNILENIIFLHLKRNYRQIYWARTPSGKEIDFVTIAPGTPDHPAETIGLWQVCYEMENRTTFEQETQALWEAMELYGVKRGTIITYSTEQQLAKEEMTIAVIPAWKFLLSPGALQ